MKKQISNYFLTTLIFILLLQFSNFGQNNNKENLVDNIFHPTIHTKTTLADFTSVNSINSPYAFQYDFENQFDKELFGFNTLSLYDTRINTDQSFYSDLAMLMDTTETQQESQQRKLLPANMSWWENFIWGENGKLRKQPLTSEARKKELQKRRSMLNTHQKLGLLTWVLMAGSVVAGQLTINNYDRFKNVHTAFVGATILGYGATAYFSLFSPPPLIRRKGEHDTVHYHKLLAIIHAAGMIALPILANKIEPPENGVAFDKSNARAHQIAGYVTFTTFSAAILTVFF
ncbi:MAG: hypothetical protein STSR0008_07280 [Ignavibacterium sp.]